MYIVECLEPTVTFFQWPLIGSIDPQSLRKVQIGAKLKTSFKPIKQKYRIFLIIY